MPALPKLYTKSQSRLFAELRQQTQPTTIYPPVSEKYYNEFSGFKSRPLTDRSLRENSTQPLPLMLTPLWTIQLSLPIPDTSTHSLQFWAAFLGG
ncbi:hypothetical protein FOXYSP1_12899 [Fusarium oxysporum f. sp. phaseoli]